MKLRQAVIVLCVLSFALAVPGKTTALQEEFVSESELTTYQFSVDSTIEVEPDVVYGENTTCFSHWYEQDFEGSDRNVVCLNWTHQAGDRYNYSDMPPTFFGPEYADYVALRIPLTYLYNVTPLGFRGSFEARLLTAGDFADNDWCASVQVYLVTEAGSWYSLQFDRPDAGEDAFSSYSAVAARQFFEYGTGDMRVEQIDLGITFDIVLLLAPYYYFGSYEEGGWKTMSGTVAVEVCGFSAEALLYDPAPVETLDPYRGELLNLTYAWPRGAVVTDSSGASYSLFGAYSLTEGSETSFVVKWDRELKIVCNRTLDTPGIYYSGVYYSGNQLYCFGSTSQGAVRVVSLVCTDSEVNVLWSRAYALGVSATPVIAQTDEDGSVLIAGYGYDAEGVRFFWLLAVQPDGSLLWNTTFPTDLQQVCAVYKQRVYGVTYNHFPVCYSVDGNLLWRGNATCDGMALGPRGHTYAWRSDFSGWPAWWIGYTLFRYDSDGAVLWNRTLEVIYPGGWADSLSLAALDVRSDGRMFATFLVYRYLYRVIFYSVSADGQSEVVRTLFDSTPYDSAELEAPLLMRGLDSCFLVLTRSYSGPANYLYTMLSYHDLALVPADYSLLTVLSTTSAAVLLAGWVLYDRVGRQRLSFRLRRGVEPES